MRTSKYSEEQIVTALRQAAAGTPVVDICRKMEFTETTFYRWRKKYYRLGVSELRAQAASRGESETQRLHELAAARVSYGYLCLYVLLRREGWRVNHIL